MFRDQKKELDRLEKALLDQEEEEPVEDSPATEIPDDAAYNSDVSDVDLDDFGDDVYDPPQKRALGRFAVAFAILTAAFCLLIWLILKNGGYLG